MTENVPAFGVRLRACRQAAGLSQQELSERSGLSIRAISDLERGRTRWPYQDSIRRLADALGLRGAPRAEFIAAAARRLVSGALVEPPEEAAGGTGAEPVPRQLPPAVRHFVGREVELAALTELVEHAAATGPSTMVISAIGGTAGVGKTALVLRWAHEFAGNFPDGQLYVNLRGYDVAQPVPPGDALAGFLRALGMPGEDVPGDAAEREAAYRSLIAGRHMLVVLDNASEAEQVRPLLPGSPTCVTLVTSRDALPGLVVRDGAVRLDVDMLPLNEAVGLLRGLIGRRVDDAPDVAETLVGQCCRLPLALRVAAELAVARPEVPLAGLTAELADLQYRLDVLEAGGDERTTVRAVFSWSYRHLDVGTARTFRLLGLHPGPDLDSYGAAALTGTTRQLAAQQLSLLNRAHLIQPAGPDRYAMHDLLRGYARELVAASNGLDEQRVVLSRLFDHYLRTAAAAMDAAFPAERHRRPSIPPPLTAAPAFGGEAAGLAWLAAELPSLVTMSAYTAEHGWPGHAALLSGTLFRYLDTAGHFPEAIVIHGHARAAASQAGDRAGEADALIGLGLVDGHQGRHEPAAAHFGQALSRFRETGNQAGQARALNYLGLSYLQQGRTEEATSHFQQAIFLFHGAGERTGEAYALGNLGLIRFREGRYSQATRYQQQALAVLREIGDRHGEATVLSRLGLIGQRQGRYPEAAAQLEQALAVFRELRDRQGEADTLARLGLVQLRQGEYKQAASQLREALALSRGIGDPSGQAIALNGLGEVLLADGHPGDARAQHAAAADQAVQAGAKFELARAHDGMANCFWASGSGHEARHHWQEALALYSDLGAPEAGPLRARLAAHGHPQAAREPPPCSPQFPLDRLAPRLHVAAWAVSRKAGQGAGRSSPR
jgi:tetratricopeptide (TPR) repeat protein/transcriptional regulator with XRE-family HTH domain